MRKIRREGDYCPLYERMRATLLAMRSFVPTTIASESTVTKHVELNSTEARKTNNPG